MALQSRVGVYRWEHVASRKFKVSTNELRDVIFRKSSLQLRINKTKSAYSHLLKEMQEVDATLTTKQQKELESQLSQEEAQQEEEEATPMEEKV